MPAGSTPASFDEKTSLFGTTNVLGAGTSSPLVGQNLKSDKHRFDLEQSNTDS